MNSEVQKMFADLWADMERERNNAIARAAKADPKKYANSKVIDGVARYTYVHGGYVQHNKSRRDRITFCYSRNRNVAGNFLGWREIDRCRNGKWFQTERDEWTYSPSKKEIIAIARNRARKFIAAQEEARKANTVPVQEAISKLAKGGQ